MKPAVLPGLFTVDVAEIQKPRFDGAVYVPAVDDARLTGQMLRVWNAMQDEGWYTLAELEAITGDPGASISAQMRHFRKKRFGAHTVARRIRGERLHGLYEYSLVVRKD